MSEGSAAFSILRIKRKRTTNQLPLDALVIEQPEPSTKRRKATHTPATVPQTSRGIFRFAETVSIDSFDDETKTRQVKDRIQSFLTRRPSGISNFQSSSQNRPLARIPSSASLRQSQSQSSSNTPSSSRPSTPTTTITKSGRKLPSSAAAALLSSQATTSRNSPLSTSQFSTTTTATPPPPPSSPLQQLQRKRTRYRIVTEQQQQRATLPSSLDSSSEEELSYLRERQLYLNELQEDLEIKRGLRPPRVISQVEKLVRQERRETFEQKERERERAREREKEQLERSNSKVVVGQTRIYDAIAEDHDDEEEEFESGRRNGKKKLRRESSSVKKKVKEEEEDANMMENFGDMLKEYLTLQDSTERTHSSSSSTPTSFTLPNSKSIDPSSDEEEEEDDDDDVPKGEESDSGEFVYDVYVRDLREPSTVTTNNGTNQSDSVNETSGGGNGFDVSSLEGLKRIGELAGLEEDEDLLLRADGEGDSESEVEDNADQDSNEENDYRNDYPDEESEDEDRWEQEDDDDNYEGNDSDY